MTAVLKSRQVKLSGYTLKIPCVVLARIDACDDALAKMLMNPNRSRFKGGIVRHISYWQDADDKGRQLTFEHNGPNKEFNAMKLCAHTPIYYDTDYDGRGLYWWAGKPSWTQDVSKIIVAEKVVMISHDYELTMQLRTDKKHTLYVIRADDEAMTMTHVVNKSEMSFKSFEGIGPLFHQASFLDESGQTTLLHTPDQPSFKKRSSDYPYWDTQYLNLNMTKSCASIAGSITVFVVSAKS